MQVFENLMPLGKIKTGLQTTKENNEKDTQIHNRP